MRVKLELDPDVDDEAPDGPDITVYDEAHFVTYLRLLDAERDGADWTEVARIVLHRDPASEEARTRRCFESHLARAHWISAATAASWSSPSNPMANYIGDGRFVSLLSGVETRVTVRKKTVDATYYGTSVPSTHTPGYKVGSGVNLVSPNALPHMALSKAPPPARFVMVGAGKTAMDVGVWLLQSGALAENIIWVMPRDSWLINRRHTQPGLEFFAESIGGQAMQMEALAKATSIDDLFLRLEAGGIMLRIDPDVRPGMMHYATISIGEVALLRQIRNVIRKGHVSSIERDGLYFSTGHVPVDPGALYIDCTASAKKTRPPEPIFQGDRIVLQRVRAPGTTFSAALVAYVEARSTFNPLPKAANDNQLAWPLIQFPEGWNAAC